MILADVTNVVVVANVEIAVLLKEHDGERTLPIFVGVLEANSIAAQLNNETFPRPLTHDLFKNVLQRLNCSLERVEVCDLVDNTFFGKLILKRDGNDDLEIDCRPSDAISLALRFSAPVFVADHVMEDAGKVIEEIDPQAIAATSSQESPPLSKLDQLQADLNKAIQEERYEDAARLRDEVTKARESGSSN